MEFGRALNLLGCSRVNQLRSAPVLLNRAEGGGGGGGGVKGNSGTMQCHWFETSGVTFGMT